MRTRRAVQKCAKWLVACLRIGWRKTDLDLLEDLWWAHHDEKGNLKPPKPPTPSPVVEDQQS